MAQVAIVGAGPIARVTAVCLAQHGHRAALWSPSGRGTAALRDTDSTAAVVPGRIAYDGALQGEIAVDVLTTPEAFAQYDTVVIALPGHAYAAVLPSLLGSLANARTLIVSGALSLLPLWLYEQLGAAPTVISWGTTLGTGRVPEGCRVTINTVRARFEAAAIPARAGEASLALCTALFGDHFNPAPNILATVLSNINPVAHAGEVLPNLTRMERGERWGLFACMTPAAARIAEAIDRERLAIARGFGLDVRSLEQHYHLSYHVPRGSLAQMAAAIDARGAGTLGPATLEHRYVLEDVPFGLVCYERLAELVAVPTPHLCAAVTMFSCAYGRDFRAQNPILDALGLDTVDAAGLLVRCAGRGGG